MNSREISIYLQKEIEPKIKDLKATVEYLEEDNKKLRQIINDMKFDVKDLQSQIDRLKGKEKR
jgi:predicted RNase H-like nuclease (RuvC/YqgF family)